MQRSSNRVAMGVNVAVKAATIALLLVALASPDLPQFQGKAFTGRAIAYPIALAVVPVTWCLFGRGRMPYPVAVDILIGLPFLIDMAGNALDLYDTIDWWDDANHFVNWAILSSAFAFALARTRVGRLELFALVVGFGGVTAILWEIGEYFAFIRNSSELDTAYTDTLGDLSLGLTGSTVAAALFVITRLRA